MPIESFAKNYDPPVGDLQTGWGLHPGSKQSFKSKGKAKENLCQIYDHLIFDSILVSLFLALFVCFRDSED